MSKTTAAAAQREGLFTGTYPLISTAVDTHTRCMRVYMCVCVYIATYRPLHTPKLD